MYSISEIEQILAWSKEYEEIKPERILLGASSIPSVYRSAVAAQRSVAKALESKLPSWSKQGVYIPYGINLEQATNELCATYKSRYVSDSDTLLDMTGGLGVDFISLASHCKYAIYTERCDATFSAAQFNLPRLSTRQNIKLLHCDSYQNLSKLLKEYTPSIIYIDPARRDEQRSDRRVYAIEDCTPNIYGILDLLQRTEGKAPRVLAKVSPMLDITHTIEHLPGIISIDIISLRSEVKELLLHITPTYTTYPSQVELRCIDLHPSKAPKYWAGTLEEEASTNTQLATHLGRYLYEPNGAVMKSGLYRLFGNDFSLKKIERHTHLYTSDKLIDDFPGKAYEILEIIPFQSGRIKGLNKRIPSAMISTRNFPLSTSALRQKLSIRDGGSSTIWGIRSIDSLPLLLHCAPIRISF